MINLNRRKWILGCVLLLSGSSNFLWNKYHILTASAKEIEVTNEWTLLKENDTIPAGMHVRMDLSTGEKWVKTIDDNENDQTTGTTATKDSGSNNDIVGGGVAVSATAVIQPDGSLQMVESKNDGTAQIQQNDNNGEEPNNYDFDMMHRTLSGLPDDEKERMGGIPELPSSKTVSSLTPQERAIFKKRMKEIWERRQQELREWEENALLDLPEVLKARVASIREYLQDPIAHLQQYDFDNREEGYVTHIVSVLEDLELHLMEIDMTRDFHTLGGWPLLVSLLSDEVHNVASPNSTLSTLPYNLLPKVYAIKSQAAWAIGTAIKNTHEFFPYATEPVQIGVSSTTTTTTTAIDLLIDLLCRDYVNPDAWEVRILHTKVIYAIGSLLRGNRNAQTHVCSTDAVQRMGKMLQQQLSTARRYRSADKKLIKRLLSLVGDIVTDVTLHSGGAEMQLLNSAIITSFTTPAWCDSTMMLLVPNNDNEIFIPIPLQETLLRTTSIIAPYCNGWDDANVITKSQEAIAKMEQEWRDNSDDFDTDHLDELIQLAAHTTTSFQKLLKDEAKK